MALRDDCGDFPCPQDMGDEENALVYSFTFLTHWQQWKSNIPQIPFDVSILVSVQCPKKKKLKNSRRKKSFHRASSKSCWISDPCQHFIFYFFVFDQGGIDDSRLVLYEGKKSLL